MKIIIISACLLIALAVVPSVSFAAVDPVTAPIPSGYYTFQKVVYQNDGGWPEGWKGDRRSQAAQAERWPGVTQAVCQLRRRSADVWIRPWSAFWFQF